MAVLLAAGTAQRFGSDKLQSQLGGRPLLAWALGTLAASPAIGAVQLVGSDSNLAWLDELAADVGDAKILEPCRADGFDPHLRSRAWKRPAATGHGRWSTTGRARSSAGR